VPVGRSPEEDLQRVVLERRGHRVPDLRAVPEAGQAVTSRATAERTNSCSRANAISNASGMIGTVTSTSQPLTVVELGCTAR
jgi:hypothetical protein